MTRTENTYRIYPSQNLNLKKMQTLDKTLVLPTKSARKAYVNKKSDELAELQELLYAENKHKVLIVLQGMDTAGKDSTVRCVFKKVDPLGVGVRSFKVPTALELSYDYLWRVHTMVPRLGQLVIFNRSHYEDVLSPVVHKNISEKEAQRRINHINNFENLLTETGTTVLKFFLHISKAVQRDRLQERIDKPDKNWKFNLHDLLDRKFWDGFQHQYEQIIKTTSTESVPWYVIPSDSRSARNQIIMDILLHKLKQIKMGYPEISKEGWPKKVD